VTIVSIINCAEYRFQLLRMSSKVTMSFAIQFRSQPVVLNARTPGRKDAGFFD